MGGMDRAIIRMSSGPTDGCSRLMTTRMRRHEIMQCLDSNFKGCWPASLRYRVLRAFTRIHQKCNHSIIGNESKMRLDFFQCIGASSSVRAAPSNFDSRPVSSCALCPHRVRGCGEESQQGSCITLANERPSRAPATASLQPLLLVQNRSDCGAIR